MLFLFACSQTPAWEYKIVTLSEASHEEILENKIRKVFN